MNLMCPARLILLPPGSRDRLTGERIAEVYAAPAAEEPATRLAEEVGARLTLLPELASELDPELDSGQRSRRGGAGRARDR